MKKLLFFAFIIVLFSCNSSGGGQAIDASGYTLEEVAGANVSKATKLDPESNALLESGFLSNGVKDGTWIEYHTSNGFPKKIASITNGIYNGSYMELSDRGQIELMANYKNNKLHGAWGTYRFGRPTKTANYIDGEMEGVYREYNTRDGKVMKEINYKNGKQHGWHRFYNDKGEITVEYEYKDGEKISGGIVDPPRTVEPGGN